MKALVYRGAGSKAVEDRPLPEIRSPGDAIVKVLKTTICGTDLHILQGDVPTVKPGRVLGLRASASSRRSDRRSPCSSLARAC